MRTETAKATLLLVEDEAALLALLRRYLERLGFSIQAAETGEAALAVVRSSEPDVVVLDLGLPDLGGEEVLERILNTTVRPRVLISSGTPFSTESVPEKHRRRVAFLQKPYLPKSLLDAVEDLLAGQPPSSSDQ